MTAALDIADITGLVVCGGLGTRLGGVDKGLQVHRGLPLAQHALQRLRPQVGTVLLNANRNLAAYAALGAPVWPDEWPDFPGPLAGWLAGLVQARTPYLATAPCDTPGLPGDLVARLAQALVEQRADIAMAATPADGRLQAQPVFCLLKTTLRSDLEDYLRAGDRQIVRWAERQRCVRVVFDDATAFDNINTPEDLHRLSGGLAAKEQA